MTNMMNMYFNDFISILKIIIAIILLYEMLYQFDKLDD